MKFSAGSVWVNKMKELHYVDSHAHIMGKEFQDDFNDVIHRTELAHVDHIMIITLSKEEALRAIAFARKNPEKYSVATGIFMDDVDTYTALDWEDFKRIAADPMISAVGEIGLDYHWVKEKDVHERQKKVFIDQIEYARSIHKPILVHSRDAMQDTYDIMKEHRIPGLMHCFSGTKEMALEFTKLGYYIALGGALTFKNSRHAREVATSVNEKYLLTETDCPYMAPEPVRGTRNEPCNIPYIVKVMAECRNTSVEHMADVIDENWQRFLKEPSW